MKYLSKQLPSSLNSVLSSVFDTVVPVSSQGPPYMEVFPSFSLNLSIFPSISQANPWLNGKKGQTFILDFLQSHIEISANFTCTNKNLVPIDQGKSILFEYQHLLCSLPLYSLRFFTKSTLSTIWTSTGNITGRCVQMQAFHWLPELHFHFWIKGSQWNACMLPVDVQIVERVHFVKKRREYRGKQQGGVDIQRE